MVARLRIAPAALGDLEAVTDYLRERDPVVAIRFVEAAQATFDHIAQAPRAYPKLRSSQPALVGFRWRALTGAFDRYLIFYFVEGDRVDVIRVLHSARDVEQILVEGSD